MTNEEVMQAVPDYAGHLAHAIRDTCFARLRKIVSFDDSYHMAAYISARLAAIAQSTSADQAVVPREPHPMGFYSPPDSFYESEVPSFEKAHPFLNMEKAPEKWGRLRYHRSHVDAMFEGWVKGRYAAGVGLAAAPSQPASSAGEVERLQKALEPFARYADAILKRRDGAADEPVHLDRLVFGIDGQHVTIGDLRRARAALTPPAPAANPFAPADDAEACTCQRFPSHQANDCPHHGLEPPFDATSPAPEAPTIPKGMKPWMSGNALVPAAARARIEGMLERLEDIRDERHFPAHMMSVHDEMVEMLEELAGDLAQEARTNEVRELSEALELIGSASDTTLMCDPLGSKRIARAALRKSAGGEE